MNTLQNINRFSPSEYEQIDVNIEADEGIVWLSLDSQPRPCVTHQLISDIRKLQLRLIFIPVD